MEVKHISFNDSSFSANGKEYLIKPTLTVKRFIEYEKLQNHFAFGKTFEEIYKHLKTAIELGDKGKGIEAWSMIVNLRDGIVDKIEDRSHPALLLCSLFIVTKDEDLTKWDKQDAEEKIKDWETEGIAMMDFFRLAANLVTGFIPILDEISQGSLKMLSEERFGLTGNIS
jgi:5'-3' exonuclease